MLHAVRSSRRLPFVLLGLALLAAPDLRADFIRGNANGDALVDIADPILALSYLFGGGVLPCQDAADANDDGLLNIADPIHLLAFLFSGGPPPSSPYPACGADPTADGLGCVTPPAACPADPPEIVSDPNTLANVDTPYHYQLQVDGGVRQLAFSLEQGPATAAMDPATGHLSWLPTAQDVGLHDFVVRATSSSGFDEQAFTVSVNEWPGAPVIQAVSSPTPAAQILLLGSAPGAATVQIANEEDVVTAPVGPAPGFAFSQSVDLVLNATNMVHVRGINSVGQESAPRTVIVIQDSQAPELFIDNPVEGSTTFEESVDLLGRVSDILSGFNGLIVTFTVDGGPAQFAPVNEGIGTNGTYFGGSLPISVGPHTIVVTAQDAVVNIAVAQVSFERLPLDPASPTLAVVSGNAQIAEASSDLASPLVVQVTDADGFPFANKLVTFTVTRSDGQVRAPGAAQDAGGVLHQAFTDAGGQASAIWRLGTDAGVGNQRVEVTSAGIQNPLLFCASALAGAPTQLNIGAGNNQRGETGMPAECVLCAWVSDGNNGVPGVPVTFTVTRGNGTMNGQSQATVVSDSSGHAEVAFVYGSAAGNNTVTADTPGNTGSPVVFSLVGVPRDPLAPTTFSGLVLANSGQPIAGATCTLEFPGSPPLVQTTTSAIDGRFEFPAVAGAGPSELTVDGFTATTVGARPVAAGTFPYLIFEPIIVPNAENTLSGPVLLPELDPANWRSYSTTGETILEVAGIEGLRMIVAPGSMKLPSGAPAPNGTPISLNTVHHDDVPMPIPDGAAPPFAWTLQPALSTFDPPIAIEYPNMSGLPPGAISNFLTFSHDTNKFEIFATGTVDPSGAMVRSDPGDGLTLAGWGCNCPPYSVRGDCCKLPDPNGCGSPNSPIQSSFFTDCPMLGLVCFANGVNGPCDIHDQCYSICGKSKADCDSEFYFDMFDVCISAPPIPGLALACLDVATVYYFAVVFGGGAAYAAGQADCCPPCCPAPLQMTTIGLPNLVDTDGDFMPDEWEIDHGLDPLDPQDAVADADSDGVENLGEFFNFLDPNLADSDGDGTPDDIELSLVVLPSFDQLDGDWSVSISGSVATPNADGSVEVNNIAAADLFGAGGPGTAPDFLADDLVRFVATSTEGAVTTYAFSEPFRVQNGQTFSLENLTFTTTPPPFPESLRFVPAGPILAVLGQPVALSLIAELGDGTEIDATPTSAWTTYRVSNPAVLTLDEDGVVTTHGVGVAMITATNEGAVAVKRVQVTAQQVQFEVVGFVHDEFGDPVPGVDLTTTIGGSAQSDASGAFGLSVLGPSELATIAVFGDIDIGGLSYFVNSGPLPVPPITNVAPIIDAGILTLRSDLAGIWTTVAPLPAARGALVAEPLSDGIHVIAGAVTWGGGGTSTRNDVYDPASDTWSVAAPVPDGNMWGCASAVVDDKLYLLGGWPGGGTLNRAYDPATDSWQTLAPSPVSFTWGHAADAIDGVIYVVGGTAGTAVRAYDVATNAWSPRAAVPTTANSLEARALGGQLYVVGAGALLQIYDPVANAWTPGPPLPVPTTAPSAAVHNGKLYVFGGSSSDPSAGGNLSAVHVFDPVANSWGVLPSMPTNRSWSGAAATLDSIHVFGGFDVGNSAVTTAERME